MTSDVKMQNYLADMTEALLTGGDLDVIRRRYNISQTDNEDFAQLVRKLDSVLVPVAPPLDFKRRLRAELLDEPQARPFWRVRNLPARVQWAAVVTVFSGFALFIRRRFWGVDETDTEKKAEEIHVLH